VAYLRARKATPSPTSHPVAAAKDSARHATVDSTAVATPPAAAGANAVVATADTSADHAARQPATTTRPGTAGAPVPDAQPTVELAKTTASPGDGLAAGATAVAPKVDSSATVRPPLAPPGTAAGAIVGGRISKIFTAMSSKDAAKVLDQMDDADIVTILSGINDRKAAEVLGLLPVARAAGISKEVLKHRMGAQ
jgi:hypothetical protein